MSADSSPEIKGAPIPVPAHFPVTWDDDVEPTLLWSWDDFHSPLPRTQMTVSVSEYSSAGGGRAVKELHGYRPGGRRKTINGYPYGAGAPGEMGAEQKAAREKAVNAAIETIRERWDTKLRPELEADLDEMKSVPFGELSEAELWQTVERFLELHDKHWYFHHLVVMPVIETSNRLEKAFAELAGEENRSAAHVLLHGTETLTIESVRGMDALAESARASEAVSAAICDGLSGQATLEKLAESSEGGAWLEKLRSYLHDFGYRCTGFDLIFPTWAEDPSFVLQVVRARLGGPPRESVDDGGLIAERDRLLAMARAAGAGKPDKLREFEDVYARGQQTWPLKEDHSHFIDQASTALVRVALAEVGRRLASTGKLASADDVWFLDLAEAKGALTGDGAAHLKALTADRRETRASQSKLTPPKYLGTFPPDHEAAKSMERDLSAEGSSTLRGAAASKGEATGIARVVLSPDDFGKVQRGDILVCRSTAPMWTPLFEVVAALVSEAGGILSHPAVVAREFNLPAVVGVPRATSLIRDGQPVTVSGTDGLVHISS
jgi:pyruvate,water dikinase